DGLGFRHLLTVVFGGEGDVITGEAHLNTSRRPALLPFSSLEEQPAVQRSVGYYLYRPVELAACVHDRRTVGFPYDHRRSLEGSASEGNLDGPIRLAVSIDAVDGRGRQLQVYPILALRRRQ